MNILLLLLAGFDPNSFVNGFAYAPNFITKTISQQTGIEPVGLLEIVSSSTDDDESSTTITTDKEEAVEKSVVSSSSDNTFVRTRFPPEPNGYLHLGHAKAVSFNFEVARIYGGTCHMRLDDTNPSKEDEEYVQSILEDVCWIQRGLVSTGNNNDNNTNNNEKEEQKPWNGSVRKTSDYFDILYECAEALIESGDAYVDSLSVEEMREYRGTITEAGKESPFKKTRTKEESMELFRSMRDGNCKEGEHILRANIDMASPNLNMRDPTLYRIKHESHQETADKWCIYPMYDFSHPISDAVEGITHSLCTLEFEDHRPLYDWILQKLSQNKVQILPPESTNLPQQIEFSRLNIKNTVLSKRKLIQLVEQKYVSGWDDPRLPTLSGLRRRGVTPEALRLFCERVGISKTDSNIDYGALEECIREEMDKTTPRAFAVLKPLKVTITNWDNTNLEYFEADRHPKIPELGRRAVPFGKELYIERTDLFDVEGPEGKANDGKVPRGWKRLLPNDQVRLRYAYVIQCDEIIRDATTQEPIELKCTYLPETRAGVTPEGMKRVKGIVHWVEATTAVTCRVNQYDRLFTTDEPGSTSEDGDFLQDINPKSLDVISNVVLEPSVVQDVTMKLKDIQQQETSSTAVITNKKYASDLAYQFERSGYFALDPASTISTSDNDDDGSTIVDLVFNRIVTLRDTWGITQKKGNKDNNGQKQRRRGTRGAAAAAVVVEDLRRVAFCAATILEVNPHPDADSLLVLKVDCGDEDGLPRTVVAGLASIYPKIEDLVGKRVVAVTNLKPAKMRGIESRAMLLAATDEQTTELLEISSAIKNGELLSFEGKEKSQPDNMLKSKGAIKAWERVKAKLRTNTDGEAIYDDSSSHRMMTSSGSIVQTKSIIKNSAIQ